MTGLSDEQSVPIIMADGKNEIKAYIKPNLSIAHFQVTLRPSGFKISSSVLRDNNGNSHCCATYDGPTSRNGDWPSFFVPTGWAEVGEQSQYRSMCSQEEQFHLRQDRKEVPASEGGIQLLYSEEFFLKNLKALGGSRVCNLYANDPNCNFERTTLFDRLKIAAQSELDDTKKLYGSLAWICYMEQEAKRAVGFKEAFTYKETYVRGGCPASQTQPTRN